MGPSYPGQCRQLALLPPAIAPWSSMGPTLPNAHSEAHLGLASPPSSIQGWTCDPSGATETQFKTFSGTTGRAVTCSVRMGASRAERWREREQMVFETCPVTQSFHIKVLPARKLYLRVNCENIHPRILCNSHTHTHKHTQNQTTSTFPWIRDE